MPPLDLCQVARVSLRSTSESSIEKRVYLERRVLRPLVAASLSHISAGRYDDALAPEVATPGEASHGGSVVS